MTCEVFDFSFLSEVKSKDKLDVINKIKKLNLSVEARTNIICKLYPELDYDYYFAIVEQYDIIVSGNYINPFA